VDRTIIYYRKKVLNAFRHHWNSHISDSEGSYCSLRCSTPFGIIGIHTSTSPKHSAHIGSAQRLSASLEFTLDRNRSTDRGALCSTPFGIIGIHTAAEIVVIERMLPVLNAFRHHWNSHCASSNPLVCLMLQCCFRASRSFGFIFLLPTAGWSVPRGSIRRESGT